MSVYNKRDFECHCGCGQNIKDDILINKLDLFMTRIPKDSVIKIHCVNRCKKHNKAVGGVADSRHLTGGACDFNVEGMTISKLQKLVENSKDIFTGGIGFYNTFVHVDTGNKRFWDMRKHEKEA